MKKITAILLAIVFTLSLTACGGATESPFGAGTLDTLIEQPSQTDSTEQTTTTTTTTTTAPTTDPIGNFGQSLKNEGYQVHETIVGEDTFVVELITPENDDTQKTNKTTAKSTTKGTTTTTKLAIPTMPKTTKTTTAATTTARPTTSTTTTTTKATGGSTATTKATTKATTTTTKATTTTTTKKPVQQYTYVTGQTHTAVPYTERYLYTTLTEQQKGWYRAIDKVVKNLEAEVFFDVDLTEDRRYYIYYMYMFDNPEHFYLANTMTLRCQGDGTSSIVLSYAVDDMYCHYGHNPNRINDELRAKVLAKKAIFDAEVKRITSTIPKNAPDVWKERLIYDRILKDSHYNLHAQWNGLAEDNWTAYGILVNKYGVCESYAEAFQTLCLAVGINCTGVVGDAGGGHKWNCVQLDGEWYMCDITFDDPIGNDPDDAYHYYFNMTSAQMTENRHDWSRSDWPVPTCTATKYAFRTYFGESPYGW